MSKRDYNAGLRGAMKHGKKHGPNFKKILPPVSEKPIVRISPRPWSWLRILGADSKPTGDFALLDANGCCLGITQREDDGILIVEAVNAYTKRPTLIDGAGGSA